MNALHTSATPPSAAGQKEDDSATLNGPQHPQPGMTHGAQPAHAAHDVHNEATMDDSPASDSLLSKQKRRRVTRACDECRRKKIRCDGKQPCTHCTVYSYECTYDQPSNRKRNPAPQYMEALENRLHKAEALLRLALPGLDLDGPRFEALGPEELLSSIKKDGKPLESACSSKQRPTSEPCDESLESMVDNTGSLDLDDDGHWDYHGHSSGVIFVRRLRKQFGNIVPEPRPARQLSHVFEEQKSASESPIDSHMPPTQDLPSRDIARQLCANALDDSCCLMRFCHKPSFYQMFDKIYDTSPDQYGNDENSFLPVLYLALAVGCLFRRVGDFTLRKFGYQSAADQGFQYFKAGRQLLDVTECRDLTSLQAVCFMILFLQATSNIRTCYSYIGIALRASLRLGLHRSVTANFNPVEIETRKRTFWVVRKMDVHVSAILGLPVMLSEDDIDQEYPLSLDDEFITVDGILPTPPNHVSLMAGVNAHIGLGRIVLKVLKYIYPVKILNQGPDHTYRVSHSKIRELERDLQAWLEALPEAFKPGPEAAPELERIRQLLRIGYAHVQMVMYRPFLHYFSAASKGRDIDKRSYACAAACVSVARNVVHITAGMKKKQLLNGSYWFTMYTTYFAILSLVYFILENPDSSTSRDSILKDALEGKNALAGLAKNSIAADRCAQSLNSIFKHLPERLRDQNNSNFVNKKRSQSSLSAPSLPAVRDSHAPPSGNTSKGPVSHPLAQRPKHPTTHHGSHEEFKSQIPHSSVDDSHTSHYVQQHSMNGSSQPRSNVPSLADSETKSSSPSSTLSLSSRQQSHQGVPPNQPMSFSPPLDTTVSLPDLMPIMFPSDDPFAYPNQPMSTLEDHHFKNDSAGPGSQFSFMPNHAVSSVAATPVDSNMGSAPIYEYFNNLQALQNSQGSPGNMSSLPNRLPQFSSQQNMSSTSAPNMPGNDFYWNANAIAPQSRPLSGQQDLPSNQLLQEGTDFGTGMGLGMTDFANLGMDNGMQVDDIIGSLGAGVGAGTGTGTGDAPPAADGGVDWNQWMDSRRWTSVDGP